MRALLFLSLTLAAAFAQRPAPPGEGATVEGVVLGVRDARPLNRAEVILSGSGNGQRIGALTDLEGRFSFRDLPPGRYLLSARRDGYLPAASLAVGGVRRPVSFALGKGQNFTGLTLRLHEAGLITGRVKYDDADAAAGITVQLYRDHYEGTRHSFEAVQRAVTNDRGEYRAAGLAPGTYYVAVYYASPLAAAGIAEQPTLDGAGQPVAREEYVTTFYPSAQRLTDAVPVVLTFGQEVNGVDIFLSRVRVFHIAGIATNGITGDRYKAPKLGLYRPDAQNSAAIPVVYAMTNTPDGGFVLQGVASGTYLLLGEGSQNGQRLRARRLVTVTSGPVDNLELLLVPDQLVHGTARIEGDPQLTPAGLTVSFESRRQAEDSRRVQVQKDGTFTLPLSPEETYDALIPNIPLGTYIQSVRVGNSETLPFGLRGPSAPVEIVLHTNAAQLNGIVRDSGQPVNGAFVRVIPAEPSGPSAWSSAAMTDSDGNYLVQGLAPGRYIALAWLDTPPCNPDNPYDRDECRRVGSEITVQEGQITKLDLSLR